MEKRQCLITGSCEVCILRDSEKSDPEYTVQGCRCTVEGEQVNYLITESERDRVYDLDGVAKKRLLAALNAQYLRGVELLIVGDALLNVNVLEV